MKWHECSNIKDLQEVGNFEQVKRLVAVELGTGISITTQDWGELLVLIEKIQELSQKEIRNIEYFKTDLDKLIFCLTEIDGKNRQKQLGIGTLHYKNKEVAKNWQRSTRSKLHTDRNKHPKAKEAWDIMESIYKEMIGI